MKISDSFYIYNQNTRNELLGNFIYENGINLKPTTYDDINNIIDQYGPQKLVIHYELHIDHESPVGELLANIISMDENKLIDIFKRTNGYSIDRIVEWLQMSSLSQYVFFSNEKWKNYDDITQDEILLLANTISSIREYIDLSNENRALFTKNWFEIFLEIMGIMRTNLKQYTKIKCFAKDKRDGNFMKFDATLNLKSIERFGYDLLSEQPSTNAKKLYSRLTATAEQKMVSETTLAIETCENPIAYFYRSLEVLVENQVLPKCCKNCGKYFIPNKRSDTIYCDRHAPQDNTKTCKKYGAQLAWKKNTESSEAYGLCRKIYMSKQMKEKRKPEITEIRLDFENFKIASKQWKADIKAGTCTVDDFLEWLKNL